MSGSASEQQEVSSLNSQYSTHQPGLEYSLQRQRDLYPHMIQSHIHSKYTIYISCLSLFGFVNELIKCSCQSVYELHHFISAFLEIKLKVVFCILQVTRYILMDVLIPS